MNGTAPIINPVLHGFHPDPSWMWHDGKAWLVTSSFGLVPGLPIYTSADLAHWDYAGAAIDATVADKLFLGYIASDERGVFAPSIRALGSAIVIVSTVVSIDSRRALADGADPDAIAAMERANGNFALVSHDGGATWDGPYWVDGATGNDPDLFIDEDGTAWWVGSHQSVNPRWPYQSDIYMRRLDLDHWTLNGPEHVLWHGAMEGATWAESPHIVSKDGWYYLFAAEAGTERRHAQSAARSKSPIGPYQGDPCNPILTHRHLGRRYPVQNIGHCDVLRDDDGQWWGVCLGSRIIDGYSFMGREPFVFPVTWEDDWPVFAPGDGLVPRIVATDGSRAFAGRAGERAEATGSACSDAAIDPSDTPGAAAHDDSSADRPASWRSVAIGADHTLHTPCSPIGHGPRSPKRIFPYSLFPNRPGKSASSRIKASTPRCASTPAPEPRRASSATATTGRSSGAGPSRMARPIRSGSTARASSSETSQPPPEQQTHSQRSRPNRRCAYASAMRPRPESPPADTPCTASIRAIRRQAD